MVRRSQEDKARSREEIVAAAATLFREQGIAGTSVADVMQAAGLTHGGFYRHFDSKDDLAVAAIGAAFGSGLRVFSDAAGDARAEARAYVDRYLSDEHTETPADGCPIALLGCETARGPEPWQAAIAVGAETAIASLSRGLDGDEDEAALLLVMLVGTVVLARAAGEGPLHDRLLSLARDRAAEILGG